MKVGYEKKIRKKNSPFFNSVNKTNSNQKTSNFTAIYANDNIKKNLKGINHSNIPKEYNLYNIFSEKGAKVFLESKEFAMMEIKLNDEIINEIRIDKKYLNGIDDKKIENENKKCKQDISKQNNINESKNKNHSKDKKERNINNNKIIKDNANCKKNNNNYDNIKNNNKIILGMENNDSKDNEFIYKFILNNANESDEKFHKKLEEAIKNAETAKKNKKNEENNTHKRKRNSITDKNLNNIDKGLQKSSNFDFSEKAKIMMTNADIKISSIEIGSDKEIKKIHKNFSIKNKVSKKSSVFFGDDEREYINDKKDSLISFLDDLM